MSGLDQGHGQATRHMDVPVQVQAPDVILPPCPPPPPVPPLEDPERDEPNEPGIHLAKAAVI